MHTHSCTRSQLHTLEEVGNIEDVRSVSEVRGGDGQGIRTGDLEEIGYVSVRRSVEGQAEAAEIAVEPQSNTWGFLADG